MDNDTSSTSVMTAVKPEYVEALIEEFLSVLNIREAERRVELNAQHVAQYGRELYPEGGQYAYFTAVPGRAYTKIVMAVGGSYSVHCFVNKRGEVLKAAGWSRPAGGVRYDMVDADSRNALHRRCEFTGGYLYR